MRRKTQVGLSMKYSFICFMFLSWHFLVIIKDNSPSGSSKTYFRLNLNPLSLNNLEEGKSKSDSFIAAEFPAPLSGKKITGKPSMANPSVAKKTCRRSKTIQEFRDLEETHINELILNSYKPLRRLCFCNKWPADTPEMNWLVAEDNFYLGFDHFSGVVVQKTHTPRVKVLCWRRGSSPSTGIKSQSWPKKRG